MFFNRRKINHYNDSEGISFFIIHDDFAEYDWINALPEKLYTLSFFEVNENSFSADVITVFIGILEELASSCFAIYKMEKNIRMYMQLGTLFHGIQDEKYLYQTSKGIDTALLRQQADSATGWDETEIFCTTKPLANVDTLDTLEQCLENREFSFYFLVDVLRGNLTIKFPKENGFYQIEQQIKDICKEMQVPVFEWNS